MKNSWFLFSATILIAIALLIGGGALIINDLEKKELERIILKHEVSLNKIENFKQLQIPMYKMLASNRHVLHLAKNFQNDKSGVEELFLNMIKTNKDIMQIRILDMQGNEQVRVDRLIDSKIKLFAADELQNKSHRDYFKNFIKLEKGEIRFSNFDLNMENKKIEIPFKPTLRGSVAVYARGEKKAIIIINYYMASWIKYFTDFNDAKIYLVDKDDYFLLHPQKEWSWSRYMVPSKKAYDYFGKDIAKLKFDDKHESIWINSDTLALPIDFFNNELTILYRLNQSPYEIYMNKIAFFSILIFISIALIALALFKIIGKYIKRLKEEKDNTQKANIYLTSFFDNTFDAIIIINEKGHIQRVNKKTLEMFGYEENSLIDKNVNILVPEPHHSKHDDYIRSHNPAMTSKIIGQERDLYARHKNGSLIPISLAVSKLTINKKTFFIGSIRNLTNEKYNKELFEKVFSKAPLGIALVLPNGNFWRINRHFCDIVGYTKNEMRLLTFQEITHPDDLDADLKLVEKLAKGEIDSYSLEKRYITKNGDTVWINLTASALFLDQEKKDIEYFIALVENITERKLMVEKLAQTQAGLIEAEKITLLGHWNWDIKKDTLYWSDGMMELFEQDPKLFNSDYESFVSLVHPSDRDSINNAVNFTLETGEPLDTYYRIITVNSVQKIIHAKGKVDYDDEKRPIRLFGTCQDVTQIKQLEEKEKKQELMLLQQSKLAAMGEMLGAIAHQWRQPLNSIGLIIQDLVSAYKHDDIDEEYFERSQKEMMQQLHFMSNTIDEFRNFFTKSNKIDTCNIVEVIEEINDLYWAQIRSHGITIQTVCINERGEDTACRTDHGSNDIFEIQSYPSEIKQLLLNLISNAKEAIEKLNEPSLAQQKITVSIKAYENGIDIEIRDLAGGIDPAIQDRIFEPYFTTKEMGTGLGLYIAKVLANEHLKGTLKYSLIDNEIAGKSLKGSLFTLSLSRYI